MSENVLILSFLKKESNINRTFNVPNFNSKSVWQDPAIAVGTSTAGHLPNITGAAGQNGYYGAISGAFYAEGAAGSSPNTGGSTAQIYFNASRSSSVYQDGQTQVVPASNMVLFCIRY